MSNANGLQGDYFTRVVIPPVDPTADTITIGPLEDIHGWIVSAEAATEVGADDEGAIKGALSWPALLSAAVILLAMVSAIFWPY